MSCPGDCLDSVCLALFTPAGLHPRARELPGAAVGMPGIRFCAPGLCAGAHTPWEARWPATTPTTAQPTLRVVGAVLVEIIAGGAGKVYGARGVGMWISDSST